MNRDQIIKRVRAYTRDITNSIFREVDIVDFMNEGIDRVRNIPQFQKMKYFEGRDDVPAYLPEQYHYLIALFSASRCFTQDDRHYQSTTFMNEFEVKLAELQTLIEDGTIIITESDGSPVDIGNDVDYVTDKYFKSRGRVDLDEGVEGVN